MAENIVRMSPNGQLVIPEEIRESAGFEPGDRFTVLPIENGVAFKKIDQDVEDAYDKLSRQVQDRFVRLNIDHDQVEDAIEWARE